MTTPPTPNITHSDGPTQEQLEAVLQAALYVPGARQDRMLGLDEWTDLARAVAACQGRTTAQYLTDSDLDDIAERCSIDWEEATDGPLPPHFHRVS